MPTEIRFPREQIDLQMDMRIDGSPRVFDRFRLTADSFLVEQINPAVDQIMVLMLLILVCLDLLVSLDLFLVVGDVSAGRIVPFAHLPMLVLYDFFSC